MKNLVKSIYIFFVRFLKTLRSIIYIILRTNLRNNIPKVEDLTTLTILANGPSLNDIENIDFYKSGICVVNFFYKSPWFKKLKPRYYVIADPAFFMDEKLLKTLIEAFKDVDWEMSLFIPYRWRNVYLLHSTNSDYIKIVPFNSVIYDGFECFRYFLYKRGWAMPKAQNVVVASIFLGINMGYKTIKLYGVDHSWTENIRVNNENQVCLIDSHFYDQEEVSLKPWRIVSQGGGIYKMHEILRDLSITFMSYHTLRKYAENQGCHIVNKTKGSYIDAFERE